MQITCANCKTPYTLTAEQIRGLPYAILPCNTCSKFIKITSCPHCNSFYSITFSSAKQTRYSLTCERCSRPFDIEFPVIREAARHEDALKKEMKSGKDISFFKKFFPVNKKGDHGETAPAREHTPSLPRDQAPVVPGASINLNLKQLFSICASSFTIHKMTVAAVAITVSFLLFLSGNWLVRLAINPEDLAGNEFIKSLLNLAPFAIILFLYLTTGAVISRITLDSIYSPAGSQRLGLSSFIARAIVPIVLSNLIIFVAIDLILILFGRIPVIGPVLFAVMFLPIYLTSLCAVMLLAIGFWFYPPVIADSIHEGRSPVRDLFRFIRAQNFSLAYTIPLMTIITAVTFAALYLLHYISFSLSMYLSKSVLGEEDMKIFSSIPASFLQISDLAISGTDSGLYNSLSGNMLAAHSVGGFIIGIFFSLISIALFASFISITATLSTHIYVLLDKETEVDDSSKIRLLALLVLILLGVFLAKKIFM